MSREIVKYGNKFNRIKFSNFNTTQANIFFAIISRLRDKGTKEVTLSYRHLAQLSDIHYGRRVGLFHRELKQTYHKIMHLSIYQDTKDRYEEINLFSKFIMDKNDKKIKIVINPYFSDFLNHLAKQFTRFPLHQYTVLRSRYAKTLYRQIKTFRLSGNVYLPIKKFRRILGVPKSYSGNQITQRVITPSKIQLTPLVRNLHIITERKKAGKQITGYHIQFKPDNPAYDKVAGFKSPVGTLPWMKQNVKYNPYLTPKQKKEAMSNIVPHKKKPKRRVPMKAFNNLLENADLQTLRYYLSLHNLHPRVTNFSEYQVRKLKKTIIKEHYAIVKKKRLENHLLRH